MPLVYATGIKAACVTSAWGMPGRFAFSSSKKRDVVAGTASIGFNVENVGKSCDILKRKGVRFVMDPTNREGEGIRLAVFLDPDGFAISLA